MNDTLHDAAILAEAALGENIVWLQDKLDLEIRQRNAEVLRRLAQLNNAWQALAIAIAPKRTLVCGCTTAGAMCDIHKPRRAAP